MVLKEDGTKWSCQQCLKGHRVSGCNHTDRELFFVPKKGRPLSQCSHCRSERKKRSHHVRCGCGEKDHTSKKCIHLRAQEGGSSSGELHDPDSALSSVPEGDESDEHTCCCHHGEKCNCSKAYSKQDVGRAHEKSGAKPRLSSAVSESHLVHIATALGHGHPKGVLRNHSAHDAHATYRVHKPNLPHHPSSRRSVDNLASIETSSKIVRTHLQQLAPARDKNSAPDSARASTPGTSEASHRAFSIPMDYMVPSGHEEFYPALTDDSAPAMPAQENINTTFDAMFGIPAGSWSNMNWPPVTAPESAQTALTYASSNTISEFGEYTPPEEQSDGSDQPVSFSEKTQNRAQQNRRSLPPSYWSSLSTDFGAADLNQSAAVESEIDLCNPPPPQATWANSSDSALFDYQMQMVQLEQANKLRLLGPTAGSSNVAGRAFVDPSGQEMEPATEYSQGPGLLQSGAPFTDFPIPDEYDYMNSIPIDGTGPFFSANSSDNSDLGHDLPTPPEYSHHFPS